MDKPHILVVDDEEDICAIVEHNLVSDGYEVTTVGSAEGAAALLAAADDGYYALLILDIMLPQMSGTAFARHLRAMPSTATLPIIFLTAKGDEQDILDGLHLGGDDYITKPFSVRELCARVAAVLRRGQRAPVDEDNSVQYGAITIDGDRKTVTVKGVPVSLTKTEYDLLFLLLTERHHVFSRETLLRRVWREDVIVTTRTVDVNITRLRKKLGEAGSIIKTRQGFGYVAE